MDELLRLHRLDRDWMRIVTNDEEPDQYRASVRQGTWVLDWCHNAAERCGMLVASRFLGDGPKVVEPTVEQCRAMEQVEVNLHPNDYTQPYETVGVRLPTGLYAPYTWVVIHRIPVTPAVVLLHLLSEGHRDDVVTTVRGASPNTMEFFLTKFDESCVESAGQAALAMAMRVACNLCLALTNFGYQSELMFPKEAARDKGLVAERSERGERARERLATAPVRLSFDQSVQLYHRGGCHVTGEPTGATKSSHWRRGHWAMLACGKGRAERRRVFRPPVLVRADLLAGDRADTTVTYRG